MRSSQVVDGYQEITLNSWNEFVDLSNNEFNRSPAYLYRGQRRSDWGLISSLDRLERQFPQRKNMSGTNPRFFGCPPLSDDEHLQAFRRAICGRIAENPNKLSDEECWALGQHYGLATRLLDWTKSPFVALFFAFEMEYPPHESDSNPTNYRSVFALSTAALEEQSGTNSKDAELITTVSEHNRRLISQSGFFVKVPREVDLVNYVRDRFPGESQRYLMKVNIPDQDRCECLCMLNKMNINYASLFPEIEGAARYVNSMWQPGLEDITAFLES